MSAASEVIVSASRAEVILTPLVEHLLDASRSPKDAHPSNIYRGEISPVRTIIQTVPVLGADGVTVVCLTDAEIEIRICGSIDGGSVYTDTLRAEEVDGTQTIAISVPTPGFTHVRIALRNVDNGVANVLLQSARW